MRVTQIAELSKSRSKVYIEQEFAFVLYKGELRLYHVREGEEISEADYRTIMEEVLPKRAKLRAMNLLKDREYTTARLRRKLEQGFYPAEGIPHRKLIQGVVLKGGHELAGKQCVHRQLRELVQRPALGYGDILRLTEPCAQGQR